jgi:hypothetical protein
MSQTEQYEMLMRSARRPLTRDREVMADERVMQGLKDLAAELRAERASDRLWKIAARKLS